MADIKISALPTLAGASVAVGDSFPIVDASAGATKRITLAELALSFANVTSFKVPDATADGEALAYDQADWRLASGEVSNAGSTVNLTITKTASGNPIIDLKRDASPADLRRYRLGAGSATMYMQGLTDAGGTTYTFLTMNSATGALDASGSSSVTVPAASAATHAAQVSAIDATTGRLAIGGVEMGDTGWRKILSWTAGVQDGSNQIGTINTTGFTLSGTGAIYLKRSGRRVSIGIPGGIASTGTASANLLTANVWPAGFQRDSGVSGLGGLHVATSVNNPTLPVTADSASSPSNLRLRTASGANNISFCRIEFETTDTWPTSLPGTAV